MASDKLLGKWVRRPVRKDERAIFEWFQIEQVDPEGC